MKRSRFVTLFVVFVVFTFSLLLTACGKEKSTNPTESRQNKRSNDAAALTVQFSWLHTIEFAGFYEAEAQGYYQDENLAVSFAPGGFDEVGNFIDPIEKVVNGEADFGIASSDAIITARANGQPVVALAAIYQRNPLVYVSLKESNILTPKDWAGKRLRLEPDVAFVMLALLKQTQIQRSDVTEIEFPDYSLDPFLNGEVDVISAFITNEVVELTKQSVEYNLIIPSDFGVEMYSNLIFTTETMIQEQPEQVEKLLRATLKGYQAAIDAPEQAAELSVAHDPTLVLENETASMLASIPLINVPGVPLGTMKPQAWSFTMQMLLDAGMLETEIDLTKAYDLSFLERNSS